MAGDLIPAGASCAAAHGANIAISDSDSMRVRAVALGLALMAAAAAGAWQYFGKGSLGDALALAWAHLAPAERAKGSGGGVPAGPAPEVAVSQPLQRRIVEWDEYVGRFDAVEAVDIKTRVSGYLTEVAFKDGQTVAKGDLLFVVDPRPYERALEQANAELSQARVKVANTALDVERGRPLVKTNVISQKTMDDRENVQRDAEAAARVAEAKVRSAELDLSYTRITAPIAGRVSRTLVTVGNFVLGGGSSGSTLLTTIVSQDPIYAYFDISENNALKYKRMSERAGKPGDSALNDADVGVGLPDETGFPHAGKLDFLDNRLDAGTGTLRARARIDNKMGLFSPGMFARLRLAGSPEYTALLLPDEAIGTDQTTRYVLVVGEDAKAQRRPVKLGPLVDGMRVVREGVTADDWSVIRGQARIRPGAPVTVKREPLKLSEVAPSSTPAAAGEMRTVKP